MVPDYSGIMGGGVGEEINGVGRVSTRGMWFQYKMISQDLLVILVIMTSMRIPRTEDKWRNILVCQY